MMSIDYYLKNFASRGRGSLSGRITALFIISGFIIFFLTSFLSIRSSVKNFVNLTGGYVTARIYEESAGSGGDLIRKNIEKESEAMMRISRFLNSLYLDFASEYTSISDISFFVRDERYIWERVYFSPRHILKTVPVENSSELKEDKNEYTSFSLDEVAKYQNITGAEDKNTYILKVSARIQYSKILKLNFIPFLTISLFILLFSRIAGLRISKTLEKKVEPLTDIIYQTGMGNFSPEHDVDVAMELSPVKTSIINARQNLNESFSDLTYKLAKSKKDQYINYKILSASSSQELLSNIKDIAEESVKLHSVGILLRTSFNNGFIVYTKRNKRVSFLSRNNHMKDSIISESTRKKFTETFEITNECEDHELFNIATDVSGKAFGSLLSIPLKSGNDYMGALFLTKIEKNGFNKEEKEHIELIAQWVGDSSKVFRSVHERFELLTSVIVTFSAFSDGTEKSLRNHSLNVAKWCEEIGLGLGLSENEIIDLMIAALLHDIGKISMNGNPNEEHPEKSVEMVFKFFPIDSIREGILHHHEKWDGSGYPNGLKAYDIPLFSRIISIADFYENAVNVKEWSQKKALSFMMGKKGISFSPELVDLFVSLNKD